MPRSRTATASRVGAVAGVDREPDAAVGPLPADHHEARDVRRQEVEPRAQDVARLVVLRAADEARVEALRVLGLERLAALAAQDQLALGRPVPEVGVDEVGVEPLELRRLPPARAERERRAQHGHGARVALERDQGRRRRRAAEHLADAVVLVGEPERQVGHRLRAVVLRGQRERVQVLEDRLHREREERVGGLRVVRAADRRGDPAPAFE
jgi:hypothetical protein